MKPTDRRGFLKTAASAAASLSLADRAAEAKPQPVSPARKLRGVNLGSWLVLEKWMNPAPFAGTKAEDEYSLCLELGKEQATRRLKAHRDTWITADDFKWLAGRGLNAVRIPVGYWILEENPPFISGQETLDRAFRMAGANGLGVLLDLHGAPGSQNGWDHSGRAGTLAWHTSKENIAHTLSVIANLAAHCKQYDNLIGFELLNEPRWDVPIEILKDYYREGYAGVRTQLGQDRTAVVIHDGFRPDAWSDFMQAPAYANVMLDTHLYQCYTDEDRKRDIHAQVEVAALERKRQLDRMQQQLPCIVGEWSCALDPQSLRGQTGFSLDAAMRAYGDAQLISYETTRGWFFWTYKTESGGGWSFRDCVKRGWLPDRYNG